MVASTFANVQGRNKGSSFSQHCLSPKKTTRPKTMSLRHEQQEIDDLPRDVASDREAQLLDHCTASVGHNRGSDGADAHLTSCRDLDRKENTKAERKSRPLWLTCERRTSESC